MPTCASTTLFHNLPLPLRPIVHCVGLAASGIVDMISLFSQTLSWTDDHLVSENAESMGSNLGVNCRDRQPLIVKLF